MNITTGAIIITTVAGSMTGFLIIVKHQFLAADRRNRVAMAEYLEYKKSFGKREQYDLLLFNIFKRQKCIDRLIMGRANADIKLLKQRQQFTGQDLSNEIADREREVNKRSEKLMRDPDYRAAMKGKIRILENVTVLPDDDGNPDQG